MRAYLRLASVLAVVGAGLPASAATYSMVDGSSLGAEVEGVQAWVGAPTAGVRYLAGQPEDFDFGYGLTLHYLQPSFEPSFAFRWSLIQKTDYNLALRGEAALHWNLGLLDRYKVSNLGMRLSPGISVGMHPHPKYATFFTLDVPFLWTWWHGGGYQLPILMGLGAEYSMSPDVNFVVFGDVGPQFEGGGGYVGGVFFRFDLWIGMSFRLF